MSDISTVGTRFSGADLEFYDKSSGKTVFAFRNAVGSLPVENATDGITAFATGGQANAVALTAALNRITTVGSANDSVVLPAAIPGLSIVVANAAAANSANVFPASATQGGVTGGDAINALGVNAAFALVAGKSVQFNCMKLGQWHSILSA